MKTLTSIGLVALITVLGISNLATAQENDFESEAMLKMPVVERKPLIQMAILLDTSGSMSGLIDQARTELWAIVNEFIFARRDGVVPELQVALYEYGKSPIPAKQGHIRQIVGLSTDLDKISEELFALKTNGGQEYCGWVIREATKGLEWSNSPDDLKVIFIAGNEPFTQGPIGYRKSCRAAVSRGIIVNTIHCGSQAEAIKGKWKHGALISDGQLLNIDQNRKVVHIEAPQDKEIAALGVKLNDTYIGYGRRASLSKARQSRQDTNAATSSREAEVQRSITKASVNYDNASWDLVDGIKHEKMKLSDLKDEQLPEKMRKMTVKEREAYVAKMASERSELQEKIQQLNLDRKKYVAEQMRKRPDGKDTLGSAIARMIREQASKRNFTFKLSPSSKSSTEENESKE